MEFTGKVVSISSDWGTGQWNVTFSINESSKLAQIDCIKDCEKLSIKAVKYRKRRSLDANAYFHVLVGKLADILRISKPRCKNELLHKYGQPYLLNDGQQAVIKSNIGVSEMLENEAIHCYPCGTKFENGAELTFYKVVRGSHTYDTREMSILIDGTVEECKAQGIDTLTPNELRRLKELWGEKHETP